MEESGVVDRDTVTRAGSRGNRGALIESILENYSKIHINWFKNIREEHPGRQESQREEKDRERQCCCCC